MSKRIKHEKSCEIWWALKYQDGGGSEPSFAHNTYGPILFATKRESIELRDKVGVSWRAVKVKVEEV
jgi:hypothetical protein